MATRLAGAPPADPALVDRVLAHAVAAYSI
jgi:hypothetical protein